MDRSLRLLQSVEPELTSADALVVLEHVEPAWVDAYYSYVFNIVHRGFTSFREYALINPILPDI
jgi:hypothetical protein